MGADLNGFATAERPGKPRDDRIYEVVAMRQSAGSFLPTAAPVPAIGVACARFTTTRYDNMASERFLVHLCKGTDRRAASRLILIIDAERQ